MAYDTMSTCALPTGTGKFTDLLSGAEKKQFNEVFNIFNGLDQNNNVFQPTYASKTEGTSITAYTALLNNSKPQGTTNNNFKTYASKSPQQALSNLNSLVSCTNDKWVLNNSDCGTTPQWSATDASTKDNDSTAICINVSTFDKAGRKYRVNQKWYYNFTATTRYTGTCCSSN